MAHVNGSDDRQVEEQAKQQARELGRELRTRADDARRQVVKQLHSAAQKIRDEAREREIDDDTVERADALARGLEKAANYLNSRTVDEFGREATRVVRQKPGQSVAVVFLFGVIVGLILRGGGRKAG